MSGDGPEIRQAARGHARHTALARSYYERWAPRVGAKPAALYAVAAEQLMLAQFILVGATAGLFVGMQFTRGSALVYVLESLYLAGLLLTVRSAINQRRARRVAADALGVEPRTMRSMSVSKTIYEKWCIKHGLSPEAYADEARTCSFEEALTMIRSRRPELTPGTGP